MTKSEKMLLKFMDMTIERINYALAMNYATQQALVESKLISEEKMKQYISDALKLPQTKIGKEALKEMFGEIVPGTIHTTDTNASNQARDKILAILDKLSLPE